MALILPPGGDSGYVELIGRPHLGERHQALEARTADLRKTGQPDDDEAGEARRRTFRAGDDVLRGAQIPPLRPGLPETWGRWP